MYQELESCMRERLCCVGPMAHSWIVVTVEIATKSSKWDKPVVHSISQPIGRRRLHLTIQWNHQPSWPYLGSSSHHYFMWQSSNSYRYSLAECFILSTQMMWPPTFKINTSTRLLRRKPLQTAMLHMWTSESVYTCQPSSGNRTGQS